MAVGRWLHRAAAAAERLSVADGEKPLCNGVRVPAYAIDPVRQTLVPLD